MPVFDAEALEFWEEHGYVVVPEAVPLENCRAAEQAVWDFLEMDGGNPDSWYPDPPRRSIMVEIYQHQALWDNRQYPRVHQAFSEIWDTDKLWVSFDRASMNPPERPDWKFTRSLFTLGYVVRQYASAFESARCPISGGYTG